MSKIRLQLEVSPESAARLDAMKERLGATSRTEVLRRAVDLLDKATGPGDLVLVSQDGTERTIVIV